MTLSLCGVDNKRWKKSRRSHEMVRPGALELVWFSLLWSSQTNQSVQQRQMLSVGHWVKKSIKELVLQ